MGIDLPKASQLVASHRSREPFGILYVGRLVPIKGLRYLIEALAGLDRVELTVAGAGSEEAKLRALCKERGVSARFVGALDDARKWETICQADAVVVPSLQFGRGRTESTPVALLEALAAGRPVVASRVGGIPNVLIDGENGLLVPPGEPAALRTAMSRLLFEPELAAKLRQGALATARNFSWEILGPAHREVLLEAVYARAAP